MRVLSKLHYIQYLHFWNSLIGLVLTCVLIGVATNIKYYVSSGAEIAGFGNFNVFVYPATFVYMFIPAITSVIYGVLLGLDPSPQYGRWAPSKTLSGSIACVTCAILLASLWPVVPGADVMTAPDAAISCSWKNYMSWYVIYANPEAFPWVDSIDTACSCFTASVGISWVLTIGWACQTLIYVRRSITAQRLNSGGGDGQQKNDTCAPPHPYRGSAALSERSMKTLTILNNNNNHTLPSSST